MQDSFGAQCQEECKNNDDNNSFNIKNTIEENNEELIINEIIKYKLKTHLKKFISILKIHRKENLQECFSKLYSINQNSSKIDHKEINSKLLSNIIVNKINSSLKNLLLIYKNSIWRKKMKYFYIWKKNKLLLNTIELEMKDKKKAYDKVINDSTQKLKNLSKKKEDIKTEEQKIITSEQKKQEHKKNLNQSINDLTKKLKTIIKDREFLEKEKEKLNKNNGTNFINIDRNSAINREYDTKKQELENVLRQAIEEEYMKDKYIQEFANNFDQQLNMYEQRAKQVINERKKQNSLEISTGEQNEEAKHDSGNNDGIKANSKY